MLYISLDEYGQFETADASEKNKRPIFVGGIIYDDCGIVGEANKEKDRIDNYLRTVCNRANADYPRDLHLTNSKDNGGSVRKVSDIISETAGDFLMTGNCNFGDGFAFKSKTKRNGKYHFFAYLKYQSGITRMSSPRISNLVRTDIAGNLYLFMAEEMVSRLILHNPYMEKIDSVWVDLATRLAVLSDEKSLMHSGEFEEIGYQPVKKKNNGGEADNTEGKNESIKYYLTNTDVYRSALAREMTCGGEQNQAEVKYFRANSINYDNLGSAKEMAFLYLSDIICSLLASKKEKLSAEPNMMISEFKRKLDRYAGNKENYVFAYDDVDMIYRDAWTKLEEKDYFEALRLTYKGIHKDSPYALFYADNCFPLIRRRMMEHMDLEAYSRALQKLYLSTRRNNLRQDELLYIYGELEEMMKGISFKSDEDRAVLYELYDAGTAAYCHCGDSDHAEECFKKLKEYGKYTDVERYLRSCNKMVVYQLDRFRFETARKIAEDDRDIHEMLLEVRNLAFPSTVHSKDYGIALSQLGQAYSNLHDKEAEAVFMSALEQIDDDTPDYYITYSYLLHYLLEMGEKEKFDQMAVKYFGGKKRLNSQFKYLVREGAKGERAKIALKFALYVFIKGVYLFHMDEVDDTFMEMLMNIEDEMRCIGGESAAAEINNHPWEIIYKYLALIALKKGKTREAADTYMEKADKMVESPGFALQAVCLFGKVEYARARGDTEHGAELMKELVQLIRTSEPDVADGIDASDPDKAYDYLKSKVINYMYS